jgi:hypothetical protein
MLRNTYTALFSKDYAAVARRCTPHSATVNNAIWYLMERRQEFNLHTVRSESLCALRLQYVDLVGSIEVAIEVCWTSLATPFIRAQRLSERRYAESVCE